MQYILLIYQNEKQRQAMMAKCSEEEKAADFGKWMAYTEDLKKSGAFIAGDALQETGMATTVRKRDDALLNTDGPFAETKEQLGGYYVINVDNLDAALTWAAKCPGTVTGSVEVRPLMVFDQ